MAPEASHNPTFSPVRWGDRNRSALDLFGRGVRDDGGRRLASQTSLAEESVVDYSRRPSTDNRIREWLRETQTQPGSRYQASLLDPSTAFRSSSAANRPARSRSSNNLRAPEGIYLPRPGQPHVRSRSTSATVMPQPTIPEASICIGIDFGTTSSSVAWASSDNPTAIKVAGWRHETPTTISYNNAAMAVKFGVPPEEASLTMFKLLLLDEEELTDDIEVVSLLRKARGSLRRCRKDIVAAISDYLGFLWKGSTAAIRQTMGEEAFGTTPLRVVITIPALWSPKQVRMMREAAMHAGILDSRQCGETTLHFVSEPEAAALATLETVRKPCDLRNGDTFLLVDAGSATLEIASYKLHEDGSHMQLRECVEGQAKLGGSAFVDQDFEAFLAGILGEDIWSRVDPEVLRRWISAEWEHGIKKAFDGSDRDWEVRLPMEIVRAAALPGSTMRLSKGHIKDCFDPTVSKLRAMVNDQINKVLTKEGSLPKAIVLVGGFGGCTYLYDTLAAENISLGIQVTGSGLGGSVTCRGAVLKAMTNSDLPGIRVSSRVSRLNYGTPYSAVFAEGRHDPRDKYYDAREKQFRADNQMTWQLKRGDDIWDKSPVTFSCYRNVEAAELTATKMYAFRTNIYCSFARIPPNRIDETVMHLCAVRTELNVADLQERVGKDGKMYRRVDYSIEMEVMGSVVEWFIRYKGQRIPLKNVEIEFRRIGSDGKLGREISNATAISDPFGQQTRPPVAALHMHSYS